MTNFHYLALAALLCLPARLFSCQPAESKAPRSSSTQSPQSVRKVIVLYKSGASDDDKSRVRTIFHGKVTTSFADKTSEEISVPIPQGQDASKYLQGLLKTANLDPAVFRAYKSATYTLQ